jgi:hypothetical protein
MDLCKYCILCYFIDCNGEKEIQIRVFSYLRNVSATLLPGNCAVLQLSIKVHLVLHLVAKLKKVFVMVVQYKFLIFLFLQLL